MMQSRPEHFGNPERFKRWVKTEHGGLSSMLLADTMAIFLVVLGFMLALPGLWLLCRGLWPKRVNYAALTCGRSLYRPFLAGVPVTLVAVVLASLSKSMPGPLGTIWAGAIICLYLMQASVGVAGLATCIGERLASPSDTGRAWRATLRGSIVLVLTYLLPILGWFVIIPASFIVGSGSSALALLNRTQYRLLPDTTGAAVGQNSGTSDLVSSIRI